MLQCSDVHDIVFAYVTHSPCVFCVRMLLNTSCQHIIFTNRYAHDEVAQREWLYSGHRRHRVQTRTWRQIAP